MENDLILDSQQDYEGGVLITATAKGHLSKAIATATVLAIIMGINIFISFISSISQLYSYWFKNIGSLPNFYRLMPFFNLIMLAFQVVSVVVLMKFIGKGRDFTTENSPYSGEQTFTFLHSLFIWMAVNTGLILLNMLLYSIGPLLSNMG